MKADRPFDDGYDPPSGNEIHHLLGSEFFTAGNIPLRVLRRNPQPPYPIHTHEFMELVVITSGSGILTGPKGEVPIGEGAVFVINGDTAHGYRDLDRLCLVNVLFDLDRLAVPLLDLATSPGFHILFTIDPVTRFRDLDRIITTLDRAETEPLLSMIDELERALESDEPGSAFLGIACLMKIMHFISRAYDRAHTAERRLPYRLGEALGYIESHLSARVPLKALTAVAGMSESSLLRSFKAVTGKSPTEYHRARRIDRACWFLAHGDHTVTEIADALGYGDTNFFSRQFRAVTGVSPSEYRSTRRRAEGKKPR